MIDYQTRRGRLIRKRKFASRIWMVFVVIVGLVIGYVLFGTFIKEVSNRQVAYQCLRLENQFKQYPEVFYITQAESDMCPELKAPIK